MSGAQDLTAQFTAAVEAVRSADVGLAAIRLLAARVLAIAPDATHMLIESSAQGGQYMCAPNALQIDGHDLPGSQIALEEYVEEHDLESVASWLSWGDDSWEQYTDLDHPYSRPRAGYYAMDLRRIVADTPV